MTGKQWQDRQVRILHPAPEFALPAAAAMWWQAFGFWAGPALPAIRAGHAMVALQGDRTLVGVAGLRDGSGGFLKRIPAAARLAYRAAPPTADLVIDGIVVASRRKGTGRALCMRAIELARTRGLCGVRAEVRRNNRVARKFYADLGFSEIGRGRYGWPWTGQVLILRHDLSEPI
ncbi:GNAT family N-acetyltransferase [Paracoccus sp. Z330]|uniref:GNAT family N-acetyltransferase n=1 Tax=Paracoccus onchidii TaxID=3017813 RepID=A0ABT4ZBJ3_9RHOB|nr:GNAT family N-acetyltransferase [Paracoccus onchidii]MDB6176736.1 GNAT family N-acetyltransferase [Paracoccus onchidii]